MVASSEATIRRGTSPEAVVLRYQSRLAPIVRRRRRSADNRERPTLDHPVTNRMSEGLNCQIRRSSAWPTWFRNIKHFKAAITSTAEGSICTHAEPRSFDFQLTPSVC